MLCVWRPFVCIRVNNWRSGTLKYNNCLNIDGITYFYSPKTLEGVCQSNSCWLGIVAGVNHKLPTYQLTTKIPSCRSLAAKLVIALYMTLMKAWVHYDDLSQTYLYIRNVSLLCFYHLPNKQEIKTRLTQLNFSRIWEAYNYLNGNHRMLPLIKIIHTSVDLR